MKILIAGASGLIGSYLTAYLTSKGHQIIGLSRAPEKAAQKFEQATWKKWQNLDSNEWQTEFESCDAVVNLIGENIADKRWTEKRKQALWESRVDSVKTFTKAYQQAKIYPKIFIQGSAIGYYTTSIEFADEQTVPGDHFVSRLTQAWEDEALAGLKDFEIRLVLLRTGLVQSPEDGMLKKMLLPFKLFIGGPIGSGEQGIAWIHIRDIVRAMEFLIENKNSSGPYNLTAPNPVTMKAFCSALGKALNRPSWAPVPAFVLKIILGEMSTEVLNSIKVIPKRLNEDGFTFDFPELQTALDDLLE